jgi:hypothetical protein
MDLSSAVAWVPQDVMIAAMNASNRISTKILHGLTQAVLRRGTPDLRNGKTSCRRIANRASRRRSAD